ncbi:hypothetical protein [Haloferula sp.]|uniref:hypothetical protein n=1 Tax=Haloferula sp. TaxID=2497595 RepID=UPI003C74FC3B
MSDQPTESDWRAFREMVPELRERFLRVHNRELASILEVDYEVMSKVLRSVDETNKAAMATPDRGLP